MSALPRILNGPLPRRDLCIIPSPPLAGEWACPGFVDTKDQVIMPVEVFEMARTRRTFSPEFKEETVALVLDKGMSIRQVARDLDIAESVIGRWVSQARIDRGDNPRGELTSDETEELRKLRRENRILREEREILKKAAAFFAKETQ